MKKAIRHPQFCALARGAEVLGERWTLLLVRELLLGPKRFSDLLDRLDGISPSVLTERLQRALELGIVRRAFLPPPAASSVYELTEDGEALRPVVYAMIRWGGRFLHPPRRGERVEPEWMRLALDALARRGPTPSRRFLIRIREGRTEDVILVAGGPRGTTVTEGTAPADATLVAGVRTLLGVVSGRTPIGRALETGALRASGDLEALADLPQLFDSPGSP
jgi:DNA-binding HxlR family transcriptional regulator